MPQTEVFHKHFAALQRVNNSAVHDPCDAQTRQLSMPTGSSSLTSKRAVGTPHRVASPGPAGGRPGSTSGYTGSNFLSRGLSRFSASDAGRGSSRASGSSKDLKLGGTPLKPASPSVPGRVVAAPVRDRSRLYVLDAHACVTHACPDLNYA